MFTEKTYNAQYLPDNMKSFVPSIVCLFLLNVGFATEAESMLRLQCKWTVHVHSHPPLLTSYGRQRLAQGRHRAFWNLSSFARGGGMLISKYRMECLDSCHFREFFEDHLNYHCLLSYRYVCVRYTFNANNYISVHI